LRDGRRRRSLAADRPRRGRSLSPRPGRTHPGSVRLKEAAVMKKVIQAAQAAALIRDGDVLSISSSSGLGCPDKVLAAIGQRFDREGSPRGLTSLNPIAAGDMYGIKGIDHIAK